MDLRTVTAWRSTLQWDKTRIVIVKHLILGQTSYQGWGHWAKSSKLLSFLLGYEQTFTAIFIHIQCNRIWLMSRQWILPPSHSSQSCRNYCQNLPVEVGKPVWFHQLNFSIKNSSSISMSSVFFSIPNTICWNGVNSSYSQFRAWGSQPVMQNCIHFIGHLIMWAMTCIYSSCLSQLLTCNNKSSQGFLIQKEKIDVCLSYREVTIRDYCKQALYTFLKLLAHCHKMLQGSGKSGGALAGEAISPWKFPATHS